MGSPQGENGRQEHEGPRHEVEITRPFYLGVYEVTQQQYAAVTNGRPSQFKPKEGEAGDLPVEQVNWDDANAFCRELSQRPAEKQAGRSYRLPTEAEWEYACRAGTETAYPFDPKPLADYGWFNSNSGGRTRPVGQLKPNSWGLHDMHGNVWEWCSDYYSDKYYTREPMKDPQGPKTGDRRVLRGGSSYYDAGLCRAAFRAHGVPGNYPSVVGYRVACVVAARTP